MGAVEEIKELAREIICRYNRKVKLD